MKSSRPQDPTRWRERDADAHALESRAAVLADAAAQVTPLGPQALSRIRTRTRAPRSDRGLFALRRLSVRARLAVGIALVLVCATTAGGASLLWRKYVRSPGRGPPPRAAPPPRQTPHPVSRVASRANAPETPSPSGLDVADDNEARQPVRRVAAPARPTARLPAPVATEPLALEAPPPPADGPAPAPPMKATEARLVAEALSELRQGNDPRAALSTLDRYAREFPHGVLETEALRTRVEAVIRLDDRKTALALLEGKPALSDGLGADLLLTRAELRAAAGRFREALDDFTAGRRRRGRSPGGRRGRTCPLRSRRVSGSPVAGRARPRGSARLPATISKRAVRRRGPASAGWPRRRRSARNLFEARDTKRAKEIP